MIETEKIKLEILFSYLVMVEKNGCKINIIYRDKTIYFGTY